MLIQLISSLGLTQEQQLQSPNGRIKITLHIPPPATQGTPTWSATFRGTKVLTHSALGIQTKEDGDLLSGARLLRTTNRSVDECVPILFGKAEHAPDRYHESRLHFQTTAKAGFDVVFRCYDDAIALRYELSTRESHPLVVITNECTSFRLEQNPTAFVQYLENYTTSHEHNVDAIRVNAIRQNALLDMPLTLSWENRFFAALTEASLRHYAGMSLRRSSEPEAANEFICALTPRADGSKVLAQLPLKTPWRVVLLAERLGAFLESDTLYCLNDPSTVQDTSWIKPGKITFPWWNGDVYDGKPGLPILSVEMAKKYIDFCAGHGIPTHSMTSTETSITPWYFQSKPGIEPGADTDVTRPRPDFDLATIKQYADSKQIRLWTWVHQAALRGRVEEAFTAFEKLGWHGMMVDFFDHDDQDSIEFAESILQAAAHHHIMIHFHGVWKPTGWQRTYPNLMNHEGALNLEYLKWSDRCSPEHDLMMAFTRMIAGPMDYHLGGFRAVPQTQFKPHMVAPNVMGTRCRMLAMYVCFDNPNPMAADFPQAYEGQSGFEFLTEVPTWWDETRVLFAEMGELLVTARRKGEIWYLGGMSAKTTHGIPLQLSFLKKGNYVATLWEDAPDAETEPNHLVVSTKKVTSKETLKTLLAKEGGFVAQIKPTGKLE